MKSIAESINRVLGFDEQPCSITIDEAIQVWGAEAAHFAFGSNSRVISTKARKLLRWNPSGRTLLEEIERSYDDLAEIA